jgi:hypothetical protein
MSIFHHFVDLFRDIHAILGLTALFAIKGRDIPDDNNLILYSCNKLALAFFQGTTAECAPVGDHCEALLD